MRRQGSLAARLLNDPLLFGAAILLAVAGILYISYTAPQGLPWQATRSIEVAVPDAGKLSKNADVRIGGARVGQVLGAHAVPATAERPAHAVLDVQLHGDVARLPVDTTAEVRLASVLGGKYLSIVPGRSERTIPWGGRLALERTSASVDIEDAFQIFAPKGRRALQEFIGGFAISIAGRGEALNAATGDVADLLPGLERVLASLATRRSNLAGFLHGAAGTASALSAVAGDLGGLVDVTATTFEALDRAGPALGESIAALPGAERQATSTLRTMRPVLSDVAAITQELAHAGTVLPASVRELDGAMRAAVRVDPAVATLAPRIDDALRAVEAFADNPASTQALKILGGEDLATFGTSAFVGLGAVLKTTWDAEKNCRVTSTWVKRITAITSDGDEGGNWLRMGPVSDQEMARPSARPSERLHYNAYPNENAQECEAGHEGYAPGQSFGNPPGLQGTPGAGR